MAFWEPDLSLEAELKFGVPKGRSQESPPEGDEG